MEHSWELTGFSREEVTADTSVWPGFLACDLQGLAWLTLNILHALGLLTVLGGGHTFGC